MFIKRRTKLIRNHWRNGIAGIEAVNDCVEREDGAQVLYGANRQDLIAYQKRAESRKDSKY